MNQSAWSQTTLGKIAQIIGGGTPSTDRSEYWGNDIPWITPKDLSNHQNVGIKKGERSITKVGLINSSARLLPKNSILFSSRAPIGYVAIAENDLSTNQGFKSLICDDKISDYKFIFYWLKNNAKNIEKIAVGSTFAEVSGALMSNVSIALPPLPEQRAIADVLSSFDAKIELLREQNETLEKTAQTIFHEWFGRYSVDTPEELPEGWRVGKLGEVIENFDSRRVPIASDKREKGEYPYYGATGINDYVGNYIFEGIYTLLGEDGSVIKENGKPFTQYVWGKIWVNNHAHVLQGKNGFSTELIKIILDRTDIAPFVNGAVQLKINQTNMNSIPVIIPDEIILEKIDQIIQPIFGKLRSIFEQIQYLSKARDTLLSKLMSREVRVV